MITSRIWREMCARLHKTEIDLAVAYLRIVDTPEGINPSYYAWNALDVAAAAHRKAVSALCVDYTRSLHCHFAPGAPGTPLAWGVNSPDRHEAIAIARQLVAD